MFRTMKSWSAGLLLAAAAVSFAQAQTPPAPVPEAQPEHLYSQQELDQMLAPIALYPDQLLTQILMAATYPLEVVKAARWSRAHPGLQGDEAVLTAVSGVGKRLAGRIVLELREKVATASSSSAAT